LDFLKKGALVELEGTPFAKAYAQEDGSIRTEIRLNISKTNILRPAKCEDDGFVDVIDREENEDSYDSSIDEFTLDEDDF
jgi:ATP-dependent protease ClpP protease subunit